jgi:general secretion pathway protein C
MLIAQLVKKNLWVANILFVIATAYLTANAINMHVRARVDTTPRIDISPRELAALGNTVPIENYNSIINRNIFNSASVLKDILNTLKGAAGFDVNATDLELIGTMAGPPKISLALIAKKTEGNKVDVYRIGDKVGEYELTAIERRLVRLFKEGQEEVLKLPDDGKKLASAAPFTTENVADGIKKIGEDERVVDRRVIDSTFENFGKLMRQARIVPHMQSGKIDGFKVYRIKDNSLYKQIGLEDGDIIKRVNGSSIEGPEDGLKLFEVFKTAKSITLDLERKGAKKTLSYSVR